MLKFVAALLLAALVATPVLHADDAAAALAAARKYAAPDQEAPADVAAGIRLADRLAAIPGPEAALWRYRCIARALTGVDYETREKEPAKSWLAQHDGEVIFSEPAGAYFVAQDQLWELWEKSKGSPLAEEIAWEAANTPLGGECEGYLSCYLEADLRGVGRYLDSYPKGKWAQGALAAVYWLSETPSAEDFPLDPADKPEARKLAERWEKILAAVPDSAQYRHGLEAVVKAYGLK